MTQSEFASYTGVSRQTIIKWENDTVIPDLYNIKIICDAFNIKIDDFVDREIEELVEKVKSDDFVDKSSSIYKQFKVDGDGNIYPCMVNHKIIGSLPKQFIFRVIEYVLGGLFLLFLVIFGESTAMDFFSGTGSIISLAPVFCIISVSICIYMDPLMIIFMPKRKHFALLLLIPIILNAIVLFAFYLPVSIEAGAYNIPFGVLANLFAMGLAIIRSTELIFYIYKVRSDTNNTLKQNISAEYLRRVG